MTDPTAMARELLVKHRRPGNRLLHDAEALNAIIEARRLGFEEGREASARVALSYETKDWESYDPRTIAAAIRALKLEE